MILEASSNLNNSVILCFLKKGFLLSDCLEQILFFFQTVADQHCNFLEEELLL